jgi:hypothetical protein
LPSAANGYGFDFNPQADRIRVVTGSGKNFRVNPNNGLSGLHDVSINGLPAGSTGVTGAAYTNSFGQVPFTGATTLYVLDSTSNRLFIQNPASAGTLTTGLAVVLDGSPLNFPAVNGFDIPGRVRVATSGAPAYGLGYAVLTANGSTNLISIALNTGTVTLIGPVGAGGALGGFALGEAGVTTIAFADARGRNQPRTTTSASPSRARSSTAAFSRPCVTRRSILDLLTRSPRSSSHPSQDGSRGRSSVKRFSRASGTSPSMPVTSWNTTPADHAWGEQATG